MHGFPLDTAKALMRNLLEQAAPDRHLQHRAVLGRRARAAARRARSRARKDEIAAAIADIEQRAAAAAAPS